MSSRYYLKSTSVCNLDLVYKIFISDLFLVGALTLFSLLFLIYLGNGIPYGQDGNETFSSIVHAYNLLNFDLSKSSGLADETYSTLPEAHSIIHTHQGNFPRIFAALLFFLGARSPEDQIFYTSVTIGLFSIVMTFCFLKSEISRGFAYVVLFFLLTDYVIFLQWHIVTYRVWHLFFLISALIYISKLSKESQISNLFILYTIFFAMFYWELLSAIFVSIFALFWGMYRFGAFSKKLVSIMISCGLGAISGIFLVVAQLLYHYGLSGFLYDLSFTYLRRNASGLLEDNSIEAFKAFSKDHNILFLPNHVDGFQYLNIDFLLQTIFSHGLYLYSASLVSLVATFSIACFVDNFRSDSLFGKIAEHSISVSLLIAIFWLSENFYLLFFTILLEFILYYFYSSDEIFILAKFTFLKIKNLNFCRLYPFFCLWFSFIFKYYYLFGLPESHYKQHFSESGVLAGILFSLPITLYICNYKLRDFHYKDELRAIGKVIVYLIILMIFIRLNNLYVQPISTIYWDNFFNGYFNNTLIFKIILTIFSINGILLFFNKEERFHPLTVRANAEYQKIILLMMMSLGAISVIAFLFPGYFYSGYVVRNLSLLSLFNVLFISSGVWWFIEKSRNYHINFGALHGIYKIYSIFSFTPIITIVFLWGIVQINTLKLLPPDNFSQLIHELRKYPGASTVSNSYAAPFFIATGSWSYLDEKISEGKVKAVAGTYNYDNDLNYLWFADKDSNEKYASPKIYVCYHYRTIEERMYQSLLEGSYNPFCNSNGLVSLAKSNIKSKLGPTILAKDSSNEINWSLILLQH